MENRFKFRFWHKPTNKMLDCYGFNEHCTFANTIDGIGTEYNPCATRDCELMQCTGLKDKNGKLIYEGDIIKDINIPSHFYIVEWFKGGFELKSTVSNSFLVFDTTQQEVIGNIYQDKELLNE